MAEMLLKSLFFSLAMFLSFAALSVCSNGQNQSRLAFTGPSSLTSTTTKLDYHGGALLTGPSSINIYLIWYGAFYLKDRTPITDFFASFSLSEGLTPHHKEPSVSTWWKTIQSYKDKAGNHVSSTIKIVKQLGDIKYSLGKNIKRAQISNYVKSMIDRKILPSDSNGIYLFLTSKDVIVERFCMGSCGFHSSIMASSKRKVVYAHVGDPLRQCPGLCAWPYAVPAYGPPGQALVAPNSVGTDGTVINIATILAGAATNPFNTGYFQGDALAPLEAVTACPGLFGAGAYPGYPGTLMVDRVTKASYNAYGANGRRFLLPAIWDPASLNCKVVA